MFTIKRCSLIRGVHYERFHCIDRTDLFVSLSCYTNEKKAPGCDIYGTSLNITSLRGCALIRYFLPFTAKDSDTISEICCRK